MITTRNKRPHDGGVETIKDRAAHLVQALENCPLEFLLETLSAFDKYNSSGTKSRSAKRWIKEFCGFESEASHKNVEPIIEVVKDGQVVSDRERLIEVLKDMPDVA